VLSQEVMLVVLACEIFCFPKRNDSLLFLRVYVINRIMVSCCPGPYRKPLFKDYVNPVLYIGKTNVKWVRIRGFSLVWVCELWAIHPSCWCVNWIEFLSCNLSTLSFEVRVYLFTWLKLLSKIKSVSLNCVFFLFGICSSITAVIEGEWVGSLI
jgi:hypothetical protein